MVFFVCLFTFHAVFIGETTPAHYAKYLCFLEWCDRKVCGFKTKCGGENSCWFSTALCPCPHLYPRLLAWCFSEVCLLVQVVLFISFPFFKIHFCPVGHFHICLVHPWRNETANNIQVFKKSVTVMTNVILIESSLGQVCAMWHVLSFVHFFLCSFYKNSTSVISFFSLSLFLFTSCLFTALFPTCYHFKHPFHFQTWKILTCQKLS